MILPEPDQTNFTQAEDTLVNLMADYSSQIDTKKASVVRQLVIRPGAYLYAKMNSFLSNWIKRTSVAYLSTLQDTSDSIADMVASNYFVTRKQGSYATGVVTITCNTSEVRVNALSDFMVDSNQFSTVKTYIATMAPIDNTEEVSYVQMFQINGQYKANIPVQAQQAGPLEIPAGVAVEVQTYIAGVDSAQLLSPITGGAGTETNADMMQRCKERCGAAIGTLQAIRTKMQDAPVNVISCGAASSNQAGCFRSRYNNMALPMGGAIDVYIKTTNQASIIQLPFNSLNEDSDSKMYLEITPGDYPEYTGAIRVQEVMLQGSDSLSSVGRYTVSYLSTDPGVSDIGARNTVYQKIKIKFEQLTESKPVLVSLQYMPGLTQLQNFMDASYGAYLGQDCKIKAAVSATVRLKCQVVSKEPLSQVQLLDLKEFITAQINSKQVGDYTLNMDVIAETVRSNYTDIQLRLPYTLSIAMPMTNGAVYTFNTTDGIASLLYRRQLYHWAAQAYFFSTTSDYIDLQVIS